MALLWRSNPRKVRGGWTALLTQQRAASAGGAIATDEFFGLIGTLTTGQGSATSAIAASIASASAPISTGQGSATTDAAFGVVSAATIDTGQGSATSDGVAHVPFIATIETGQGEATSDASFGIVDFQGIRPVGFWDAANVTTHPGASFWRLNPRTQRQSLVSLLAQQEASQALAAVAAVEQFTSVPFNTYADGFGAARATFAFQAAAPSGINDGAFGTAAVRNNTQYLVASGTAFQAFGLPTLYNLRQYITATGIASAQAFGTAGITNSQRFLNPTGTAFSAFGTATVRDPASYVTPTGASWGAFGTASVYNYTKNIATTGAKWTAYGTAIVQNKTRYIFAQRIDPKGVGTPSLIGPRYITASSGNTALYGSTSIVGPRTLYEKSLDHSLYGTAAVTRRIRYLTPAGIVPPTAFGLPGLANTSKLIEALPPEGLGESMGNPIIGEPPFDVIWGATADDQSLFGDAEIERVVAARKIKARSIPILLENPDPTFGIPRIQPHQITATVGNAGAFGKTVISNWIRTLQPQGVVGFKYGPATSISNWIRYVGPDGFDHSLVWNDFGFIDESGAYAHIYNARGGVVGPAGMVPPGFGAPSVGYRLC